jgi:transposase-like protein
MVVTDSWIDRELAGCQFKDMRLGKRFRKLLEQLSDGTGESIPFACQDWASTKAAYRFLSNERVKGDTILAGHFHSTRDRFTATNSDSPVLILHDTTEFTYSRTDVEPIGILHKSFTGRMERGRPHHFTVCGILMHSSLAVTTEGLPLGLAAIKFWTRSKFKGTNALKRKINPTRVPIEEKESFRWLENLRQSTALLGEPRRCVHIGDRESDIYELFCAAQEVGTSFLVRTCVDRLAGDGSQTIAAERKRVPAKGLHRIEVRDRNGELSEATLELKWKRIQVLPPIGNNKHYPELTLTVIYAQQRMSPEGRERIDWKLITDLPVRSRKDALRMLNWYALRWKIETFHKILKSGCKAEESKLRTAERLVNLISSFCILAWRIFWMTMINRCSPEVPPTTALTDIEIQLLDRLIQDTTTQPQSKHSLSTYMVKLARLGGYLARSGDPPPGPTVMWRGLSRLVDIELGFSLGSPLVGN